LFRECKYRGKIGISENSLELSRRYQILDWRRLQLPIPVSSEVILAEKDTPRGETIDVPSMPTKTQPDFAMELL
jgi:hypothetical protein